MLLERAKSGRGVAKPAKTAVTRSPLWITSLLCCVLLFAGYNARAAEEVSLYINYLPHRITGDSGKQYDLFREELFKDVEHELVYKYGPLKRSATSFSVDRNSCLFPTNAWALKASLGDQSLRLISSAPVDVVSLRLYTKTKHSGPVDVDRFQPERIGYILGSGAIALLGDRSKRFMPLSSEEQLIRMLELDRLDAFLGHHPDTALALDDLNKPDMLHVTPAAILDFRLPISVVCHDSEQFRSFQMKLDPRIKEMATNGRLQDILGRHAEIFDHANEVKQDF